MPSKRRKQQQKPQLMGFLGLGLDSPDEHMRITKAEHFFLMGGSNETHEKMQDTAIYFNEGLEKVGKSLIEITHEEVLDLFRDAIERQGPK